MPPLWWAALATACVYVGIVLSGATGPIRLLKVVPAVLLGILLAPTHPLAAGAMAFSAAGDALLLDKDRYFLHGLVAFLLGHLLFVPAFVLAAGTWPSPWFVGGVLAAAAGVLQVLKPKKRVMKFAVPVYALVLGAMVAAASTMGPLGLVGGLSFLLSDTLLGVNRFVRPVRGVGVMVIVTYYGALLLFSAALG